MHSLRYVNGEIKRIALDQRSGTNLAAKYGTEEGCPEAILGPPLFSPDRVGASNFYDFPQRCVTEVMRRSYINSLKEYLVSGTISLFTYEASPGDLVTLTIEARGADKKTLGATARFYIQVTNYGWKLSARDSLMFVKRLNVPEHSANLSSESGDRTAGLRTIRFRPYPGFTLGTTYYRRATRAFCDASTQTRQQLISIAARASEADRPAAMRRLDDPQTRTTHCRETPDTPAYYRVPSYSWSERFWRVLAPGVGLNLTIMHWDDDERFDPTTDTFAAGTTAKNFQLGVGPVVSLFGDRISAAYGWNLMAGRQRMYLGFGFSFIQFGRDIGALFSKQ